MEVKTMHRTQIYLQDTVYEQLKHKSQLIGVSISELIRRAVEQDLNKTSSIEARAFFDALTPLQSFATTEPEQYVDDIRSRSRILQVEE
jgi:predicted CopG family antitoxin